MLNLLQPLARWWGRQRHQAVARRTAPAEQPLPVLTAAPRGEALRFDSDRGRGELAAQLAAQLRRAGVPVAPVTGWEDHDGEIRGSLLLRGQLVTSGHIEGSVLARIRRRVRRSVLVVVILAITLVSAGRFELATGALGLAAADLAWGLWRTGPSARRKLRGDACSRTSD
jgi:hypothetical protein